MRRFWIPVCALLTITSFPMQSYAKRVATKDPYSPTRYFTPYRDVSAGARTSAQAASSVVDTFLLAEYTFGNGVPDPQGWFSADRSTDIDTFFHVASAAELDGGDFGRLVPIEGAKSLWCGIPPGNDAETCAYAVLPGYGNQWRQGFSSSTLAVIGDVTISFAAMYDSEPWYDHTGIHYQDKDGTWITLFDTSQVVVLRPATFAIPAANHDGSIRFAFTFESDGAWSDEDGLWDTDGAVIIDSIVVEDDTGIINYQDFESEPDGAHRTNDSTWQAAPEPGFGDFAAMFPGVALLQEDACFMNASTIWGFVNGSTDNYSCGGHPQQAAVPYPVFVENEFGSYFRNIENHVVSPVIDVTQDVHGNPVPSYLTDVTVEFDVYRDMPVARGVLFVAGARSFVGGCAGTWRTGWGGGGNGSWMRTSASFALWAGADEVQVSLGVTDPWTSGYPNCHSHAPLYDNVRVYMLDARGPHWGVGTRMLYQDAFPADGTTTGKVRMDIAFGQTQPNGHDVPGDSIFVEVTRPGIGMDHHIPGDSTSGTAVYLHVKDVSPTKSGPIISGDLFRHPVVDQSGGWTAIQFDTAENNYGWGLDPDEYSVDLNDTLYAPGDTVYYYFSARDFNGETSYWSLPAGGPTTQERAALFPMEVTCLPANASNGTTDILYVDGADGEGVQPFFDTAFQALGITPDRYDQIAPWSTTKNSPGARRVSAAQLAVYRTIIWNTGDLIAGLWTNNFSPDDDYALLRDFLDQGTNGPGLYLSGNNIAERWVILPGDTDAIELRDMFINFTLLTNNHQSAGEPFSPPGIGVPGGCFDHGTGPDSVIVFGGCNPRSHLDVLQPFGAASTEMTYSGNPAHGAVLAQATANTAGDTARVVYAGFSYDLIRDDKLSVPMDRIDHLRDILGWLNNGTGSPTAITGTTPARTSLAQNYPNPFNPTTTITFTLAERGSVSLAIYNVRGQKIRTLVGEARAAGVVHTVEWDGTNDTGNQVSSGIYFYRLTTTGFNATRKMVLLK